MFYLHPTESPARFVPSIAGVPDSQARDLDRRRRLNRQLLTYRAPNQVSAARETLPITGPAVPIPA